MRRRCFLKRAAIAAGMAVVAPGRSLGQAAGAEAHDLWEQRDRFGGCPAVRFEPSGAFRLEKRDRWWLVTPDGNAFLSLGLNHVHPGFINQPYNAEHWRKAFGAERFRDEAWVAGLRRRVRQDLEAFGYNTLGVHNQHDLLRSGVQVPWIRSIEFVRSAHWRDPSEMRLPDVFSPDFERHCDTVAERATSSSKEDPFLLGYAMTDCPIMTEIDAAPRPSHIYGSVRGGAPAWPRLLRNLPAGAPGKQAYVRLMRDRHSDWIHHFNQTYGTDFADWQALGRAVDWRPDTDLTNSAELADHRAFLERVVDRYYSVMTSAVRRHDPNHLVFGDKLNANTDAGDAVVAITSKHTDLIFYQMYGRWAEQRPVLSRWAGVTDKPFFNGDGTFAVPHPLMPNPYGPHALDQSHRADLVREFCERAFDRPDFVGWTVCGWVDTWRSMSRKEHKQHSGVMDAFGTPYEPLRQTLQGFSKRMYRLALQAG